MLKVVNKKNSESNLGFSVTGAAVQTAVRRNVNLMLFGFSFLFLHLGNGKKKQKTINEQ